MRCLVGFLFCLLTGEVAWSQSVSTRNTSQDQTYSAAEQKLIDQILVAKYPYFRDGSFDRETGFHALFQKAGIDGLKKLQSHPDDSIGLQAAWEEVELTVPTENPGIALRPDRKKLEWFLSFLEKRCNAKAPSWWATNLLNAHANRRYNIYLDYPEKAIYHKAGLDFIRAPLDTTLSREGTKFILKTEKHSIAMPKNSIRKWSDGKFKANVSALFTPSRCYVAIHGDVSSDYQLICLDRTDAKKIWESKVWGSFWGHATGIHTTWVTITEQDKRIVIFGQGTGGFHVEGFRPEDGKNLFRVSSGYGP